MYNVVIITAVLNYAGVTPALRAMLANVGGGYTRLCHAPT